jgi:mRNA (guanine-N7-)-methyltransferase
MNIRDHYNKLRKTTKERVQSTVVNIRYANNFIKAVLIRTYVRPNMSVLDLGCGKGGDLIKYNKARISEYYGLDIAELSIYDARLRHNDMSTTFRGYFDYKDVYNEIFDLQKEFDIVSSQFSLHYAFSTDRSLETTVGNINRHLKNNGYFIFTVPNKEEILRRYNQGRISNKFYSIRYEGFGNEYYFSLKDCVNDCVEYFVDIDKLSNMLSVYNIRLIRREMFNEFYRDSIYSNRELARVMKCKELSYDEMEVISLYEVVVFKRFN